MISRIALFAAIAGMVVTAIDARATGLQDEQLSKLTGSARITGRLLSAEDGKPVRRAEVHLSGRADAEPDNIRLARKLETDRDGRFEFGGLPPGNYAIMFDRITGFVAPKSYQQTRLTGRETVDVTIRIRRTGAIEGRILDQYGDPLLGADVLAIERVDLVGSIHWGTHSPSARTNDRGEFRIFNLPAGDYFILASRPPSDHPHDPPPPPVGYVTTYYPGVTARRDARFVRVRAGRDTKADAFNLVRRNLATITVAAVDSRGDALGREGSVYMRQLHSSDMLQSSVRSARRDGSMFVLRGVEPGDYSLVASSNYVKGEAAFQKISIDQTDAMVKMQTNTGARMSGRVIVDGRPAEGGPGLPNVSVYARTPPRTYGVSYADVPSAQLRRTDRFELAGLRGPMRISGDVTYGKLLSIRRGDEDLTGKVIEFVGTEQLNDVVVEFTTHVGRLEVTVPIEADADFEPLVFIFPDDRHLRGPEAILHSRLSTRVTDASGTKAFRSFDFPLVPGRYLAVALNSPSPAEPFDPALLEALSRFATPISLTADSSTKLTLAIAKTRR